MLAIKILRGVGDIPPGLPPTDEIDVERGNVSLEIKIIIKSVT